MRGSRLNPLTVPVRTLRHDDMRLLGIERIYVIVALREIGPDDGPYQLQYAYISPVRNDFGDLVRFQAHYPLTEEAPLSRRLALDRAFGG